MMQGRKTVAVIGAGIVGVATAIWLQREGMNVILIDREGPAAGASHGNAGLLAACSIVPLTTPGLLKKAPGMLLDPDQPLFMKWRYLPRLAPWLVRFLRHANARDARRRGAALAPILGDTLADHQALSAGTGAERWVIPTDCLFVYRDRAHFDSDAFAWSVRGENGFTWDLLNGAALRNYDPAFGPANSLGVKISGHGRISDPGEYVRALAAHARKQGAKFIRATVEDVRSEGGCVTGLRADGQIIACDAAVLAAGAWSGPLAKAFGLKVPLESERGYHLELWEPSVMPRSPIMFAAGKFAATPMEGRLRLAGIVEFGGLDAPPSRAPVQLLEKSLRAAMPDLTWKRTVEWMGHRPSMADSTPVIGEIPGLSGAFAGFGHDHVGLTGGPKTGQILAQLIAGKLPNLDMSPYSPARFVKRGQ